MSGDQGAKNNIARLSKSDEVTKRLLELIDRYDYQLVQENGQRRLTSACTEPRKKGAEIFLGRLPRDCYEDELVPILMKVGRVIELRLMMDFSGSTRGYAFASFENPRVARRACDELNGYEIRAGHKIGVVKSIDNCRLFLGGVPKDKTKYDFMKELGKMLDGITNIYVYPSTEDKNLNRGFVFVEFKDHRSAAMARRKLIPGRVMLWDHEVAVDWADPEPGQDIDDEVMETVSALFVRNLPLASTEHEIRHVIQRFTGIQVMKIKKINHFAFLHYETRAQAQRVLDIMKQSQERETSEWELTWAKPIRKSEKLQERLRCVKNQGGNQESKLGIQNQNYNQNRKNQTNNNNINNNNNNRKEKKNLNFIDHRVLGSEDDLHRDRNGNSAGTRDSININSSSTIPVNMNKKKIILPVDSKLGNFNLGEQTNAIMINDNRSAVRNRFGNEEYFHVNYLSNDLTIANYGVDDNSQITEFAKALGELADRRFHAYLRYEYWGNAMRTEFFCKIILEKNGRELMSYQGNSAPTMHEAIRLTVPNAYAKMQSMPMQTIYENF